MPKAPGRHLPLGVLEEYAMGRLREAEMCPLELHLLLCRRCRRRLARTDDFIRAARSAMLRMKDEPGVFTRRLARLLSRVRFLEPGRHSDGW